MDFKQYYGRRLRYMFNFYKPSLLYKIFKVLCLIVGVPLSLVLFVAEMVITFVYMLFMWIPFVNIVLLVVFKVLTNILSVGFYISILPDLKLYIKESKELQKAMREQDAVDYTINDAEDKLVDAETPSDNNDTDDNDN